MDNSSISDALSKLNEDVSVELASTSAALQEAYSLRYQVYCRERAFLSGQNSIETDEFDHHSRHALIRWRRTGEAIGTVRLVLPLGDDAEEDFPMEHVCDPDVLTGFPRAGTGEVSRFALSKQATAMVREACPETAALLRLALLQGALWMSAEAGHSHWLAVMQPTLLRLLRSDGLQFQPLGPLVDYHGRRQPVLAHLGTMLGGVAREQPAVWRYLTRGGAVFSGRPAPNLELPAAALLAQTNRRGTLSRFASMT
ncbi:MAG: PEP-CTERM/exosortase system-associated acyltransferase [Proteobacteria bacterium]|nr:PEP-CTERM/exosortase system-associated acyltransferase [Pseudomonadota bacterium]